jgi:hypothetical protein
VTHARPTGCEGRGAFRATGQQPALARVRTLVQAHRRALPAPHPRSSRRSARCVVTSRLPYPCERGRRSVSPRGHLDAGPNPAYFQSQLLQAGASVGVEPTTDGTLSRCSYLTELTCWRQRPRPRAVHASAIRSAGAPGGTQEPAPLTRLPSRPLCGRSPWGFAAEWNTRQESNLRALGSKPNGDAGNPRLVYWIRRQESDLRGLRSERSWDASNPHLNDLAGRQGIEPC